jgi:hypothetical protein
MYLEVHGKVFNYEEIKAYSLKIIGLWIIGI